MNKEVIKAIKSRRSTRQFLSKQVDREIIETIVECGFYAPSSYNTQTWHFTVVQDEKLISDINFAAKEASRLSGDSNLMPLADNKDFDIFYGAPTIIVVSGQKDGLSPVIDCALASQNMLLAAEALGIGSCWNGIVKWLFQSDQADNFKEKLNIPESYQVYHAIAIGHKAREYSNFPRRDYYKANYIG
ncbi:nitroreductase [Acidaminobacter sp. JC074]|uniref:nitroreductase family protein n=1 Tax=Acidaminobacter sp. JC074 TaxID=2530199 RepID=UPI001F10756F|nr:nitroreductase [Acidaminobacter sp. JC074]